MTDADAILDFWFGPVWKTEEAIPPERMKFWFMGGEEVDRQIQERFSLHLDSAGNREFDGWSENPRENLALILILDQFSRNIHRNTGAAFDTDRLALEYCQRGLSRGDDRRLPLIARTFLYLPLEHSEDLDCQERSVELFSNLPAQAPPEQKAVFESFLDYAIRHRDIIAQFGRFPHRNEALGRESTAEEIAFLKQPGSSF